jgi:hypothetical protein
VAKKRKRSTPHILVWDQRMQARLEQAVESLRSLVADLTVMLSEKKRRSDAARKAHETMRARAGTPAPSIPTLPAASGSPESQLTDAALVVVPAKDGDA